MKRIAVLFFWIVGAFALIVIGGFLCHTAGTTTTTVIGSLAFVAWLASLFIWRNNIFSGISFFTMAAAGFAIWMKKN